MRRRAPRHRAAPPGTGPPGPRHRRRPEHHHVPLPRAVDRDDEFAARRPPARGEIGRGPRDRLWAPEIRDHVRAAVTVHTSAPVGPDDEPRPGAPARPVIGTGHLLHVDFEVESRDPLHLLGEHRRLHRPLRRQARVRVVAAARAARTGHRAHRWHPVRRGRQHLGRVGTAEAAAAILGHPRPHHLTGQPVPDEHHPAVVAAHAEAAVPRLAEGDLEALPDPAFRHRVHLGSV